MENKSSIDDLKILKNYVLGVIAFATAVSTFLVQVFGLAVQPTLLCVGLISLLFLLIVFLMGRSENRQRQALRKHEADANKSVKELTKYMRENQKLIQDLQLSSLRLEMNLEIKSHPENHDTILKYAHKYFEELGGDWVQTELFESWRKSENALGREVNLPEGLLKSIKSNGLKH